MLHLHLHKIEGNHFANEQYLDFIQVLNTNSSLRRTLKHLCLNKFFKANRPQELRADTTRTTTRTTGTGRTTRKIETRRIANIPNKMFTSSYLDYLASTAAYNNKNNNNNNYCNNQKNNSKKKNKNKNKKKSNKNKIEEEEEGTSSEADEEDVSSEEEAEEEEELGHYFTDDNIEANDPLLAFFFQTISTFSL